MTAKLFTGVVMENDYNGYDEYVPDTEPKKTGKKIKPLDIVWIALVFLGFGFFLYAEAAPYVPSGHVLDEKFLNTLKYMTFLKYVVPISAFILLIVPCLKRWIKDKTKWIFIVMLVFVVVTACILGTRNKFNAEGVGNAFADTPSVVSKTVTDKKYSRGGKTYTIYFDDDTFAHVNNYHYKGLESGDEVYVVSCDGEPIGVFKTSEYSLP